MTSSAMHLWPGVHRLCSAFAMNPSIFPPSTSARLSAALCGAPGFWSLWSTNGATHLPVSGSGTQTAGFPAFIGIPSAPG